MEICIFIPGNIIGGGVKMPVRLASTLADRHDVTLMYPVVKYYTAQRTLWKTPLWRRVAHIGREILHSRRPFFFKDDLSGRVKLRTYLTAPDAQMLEGFDVLIYVSVLQYYELKGLALNHLLKVHWSLADYLFGGVGRLGGDAIMEAYRSGDIIVAPSERTRADLESYGVPVRGVAPGGVDPLFSPQGRATDGSHLRVLGYYQPAWWVKGAATLVQCLVQLRSTYPDVEVSLFGHQPSDVQVSGSWLCDRFHTGLRSPQVADLYRCHDIFIYPSYSDGFPAPPLEAMACGCAVVTTPAGAAAEYAQHEHNALVCDFMDHRGMFRQVERLIQDPDLRARLGRQAAEDARRWTWEACADKFEGLLAAGGSMAGTADRATDKRRTR